jgi:glycosyltransferase involved in cell wall biosynthesis
MKTLLLDLTSLDTPSRTRGPGRYVRDLARGLASLPSDALSGMRLLGLTRLGFDGSYSVTADIGSFEGSASLPAPAPRDHYRWAYARRIALWRAVNRIGAEAVHLGDPHATPLFMSFTSCKTIVTCHDAIPVRFPDRYMTIHDGGPWIGTAIERRRYRRADLVVAVSDATKVDASALLGAPAERVVRVYNGVDVDKWARTSSLDGEAVLRRRGLFDRPFALYVGGYHWHKNVEGMVDGLAIARSRGADLILAWAGKLSEAETAIVDEAAQRAGVSQFVQRLGYVSDEELAVLYRAAVAHVLASRGEGFGFTVVESMAAGCPVVTTRAGSLAEVAGDAALVVDPEDHGAIADALVRLHSDPALREELRARGRARAPRFSLEAQARDMAAVYRRVLAV